VADRDELTIAVKTVIDASAFVSTVRRMCSEMPFTSICGQD
jgi:hypothetical protein